MTEEHGEGAASQTLATLMEQIEGASANNRAGWLDLTGKVFAMLDAVEGAENEAAAMLLVIDEECIPPSGLSADGAAEYAAGWARAKAAIDSHPTVQRWRANAAV